MKSGSLLIEATRASQSRMIRDTKTFMDIEVKASPHRTLNTSRGVIRDHGRDLYDMSDTDIVYELKDQGVENVSRFILTCSLCRVELVVQFPARGSTQVLLCLFPGVLWL